MWCTTYSPPFLYSFFVLISLTFGLLLCFTVSCLSCLENLYLFSVHSDTQIFYFILGGVFLAVWFVLFLPGLNALWACICCHPEISLCYHPVASLSPLFCKISNNCVSLAFLFLDSFFCFKGACAPVPVSERVLEKWMFWDLGCLKMSLVSTTWLIFCVSIEF